MAASSLPDPKNPHKGTVVQEPSCDFDIVVSESDFCVIEGKVHDVDISLVSTKGICKGSATVNVNGLPVGATVKILPSSMVKFFNGVALATVRIDTANMNLKEIATSTLTVSVSKKGVTRRVKANMMVDLPVFDFSIRPSPPFIRIYQEDVASTTVNVKLLGAACKSTKSVVLSLDPSSNLPSTISHSLSSSSVVPPGEVTILFKASSGLDIGSFKAQLVGCCTDEDMEKVVDIPFIVDLPRPPESERREGVHALSWTKDTVMIESKGNFYKMAEFSKEEMELTEKVGKDMAAKGYTDASEEEVQALKNDKVLIRPMNQVNGLSFKPVSLKNTPFQQFHFKGGFPDNEDGDDGTFLTLSRIFTMPNGSLIMLTEDDLIMSGGKVILQKDRINENVNGSLAILTVQQSPSGNALTSMSWTTTTTDYTLEMEGNVMKNGQYEVFLNLARSIPTENRSEETYRRRDRKEDTKGKLPAVERIY